MISTRRAIEGSASLTGGALFYTICQPFLTTRAQGSDGASTNRGVWLLDSFPWRLNSQSAEGVRLGPGLKAIFKMAVQNRCLQLLLRQLIHLLNIIESIRAGGRMAMVGVVN